MSLSLRFPILIQHQARSLKWNCLILASSLKTTSYKVNHPNPTPNAKPTLCTTCIHLEAPNVCMWYIVLVLLSVLVLGGFTLVQSRWRWANSNQQRLLLLPQWPDTYFKKCTPHYVGALYHIQVLSESIPQYASLTSPPIVMVVTHICHWPWVMFLGCSLLEVSACPT